MTSPNGDSPDGSIAIGMFAARQAQTETQAKDEATNGAWKGSWNGAQSNMKSEFVSAQLVNGEIVRLDNRIDELIIGTERAIRYTYSESDVWTKHPAAYKIEVDVFAGATSGTQPSNAHGQGGWAGGWNRETFVGSALEDLPSSVAITIGAGATPGNNAAASWFGTFVSAGGATTTNYGAGNRTYKMRGGTGGGDAGNGTDGSAGPFHPGGSGGVRTSLHGTDGGHGFSAGVGQVGTGSAGGGGGGGQSVFGTGGDGGHGGWPSGPGGGRGYGVGGVGVSGNGAPGAVIVTVYVEDTFGSPPSTPINLVASSVTKNSAHVTWDASVDDVMVKNYVLYLNGSRYGVVDTLFHDFVGLTASTAYSVRVQAVDIGDNVSELSAVLSFTTLAS